jgi:hypothetical protein
MMHIPKSIIENVGIIKRNKTLMAMLRLKFDETKSNIILFDIKLKYDPVLQKIMPKVFAGRIGEKKRYRPNPMLGIGIYYKVPGIHLNKSKYCYEYLDWLKDGANPNTWHQYINMANVIEPTPKSRYYKK